MTRRISISEARRILPQLVREVAADGGRVDITYRGKPQVSLLRVADVKGRREGGVGTQVDALKVELTLPSEALLGAIREIRRAHAPRTAWLTPPVEGRRHVEPRGQAKRKRATGK